MKYETLTLNFEEKIALEKLLKHCLSNKKDTFVKDEEMIFILSHLQNKVSKNIKNCVKLNID